MSYTVIKQTDSQLAHIKFEGPFHGETVTWDTYFYTLDGYIAQLDSADTIHKQFIEIEPIDTKNLKLTIALKIDEINEPNIEKMMIMVKQYKNLDIGRYEYG